MDTTPQPAGRQALIDNVAFWQTQSDRLELDNSRLPYYLAASPILGMAVFVLTHVLLMAAAAAGVLAAFFALGTYMVSVRRAEYAFALKEAQAELARFDQAAKK